MRQTIDLAATRAEPTLPTRAGSTALRRSPMGRRAHGHLGDTVETVSRTYVHWLRDDRDIPAPDPRPDAQPRVTGVSRRVRSGGVTCKVAGQGDGEPACKPDCANARPVAGFRPGEQGRRLTGITDRPACSDPPALPTRYGCRHLERVRGAQPRWLAQQWHAAPTTPPIT